MARDAKILTVLLASPGDVSDEREIVAQTITDFNITWGPHLSIHLDLLRWETHSVPDVGADAQDVINRQFGENYDIFIGLLWRKFGTPTGRAGSGTEEEFNRAFARHEKDPNSVKIMFYFSNDRFFPGSEQEIQQFQSVFAFKKRIQAKGVLYQDYASAAEFPSLLRIHLAKQIQAWIGRSTSPANPTASNKLVPFSPSVSLATVTEHVGDDDAGIMDLTEMGTSHLLEAGQSLQIMIEAQNELRLDMEQKTRELSEAVDSALPPDPIKIKTVVNATAAAMDQFSMKIETETKRMSESYRAALTYLSRAIPIVVDFGDRGTTELKTLLNSIASTQETLRELPEMIRGFAKTIKEIPRATTNLNQARRRTINALDVLEKEIASIIELNRALIQLAEKTLSDVSGSETNT
jgi:hypothetical protein